MNAWQTTPLHNAAENGHEETVSLLIAQNANIEAMTEDKNTPLHLAAEKGHVDCARVLINHKANIATKNENQYTPLDLASENGETAMVNLLNGNLEDENLSGQTDEGDQKEGEENAQKRKEQEIEEAMLTTALTKGKKPWGRSKIMIVGEGRAGKTALSRAIMGEVFEDTSSTIGISELTCNVQHARVGGGGDGGGENCGWSQYVKPAKELEAALAALILSEKCKGERDRKRERKLISTGKAAKTILDEEQEDAISGKPSGDDATMRDKGQENNLNDLPSSTRNKSVENRVKEEESATNQESDGATSKHVLQPSNTSVSAGKDINSPAPPSVSIYSTFYPNTDAKKPPAEAATLLAIDHELVMKCLADNMRSAQSKFVLSLFDFGGQSVFNVIHPLFLTRYGVYLIVFNMEWMVSQDDEEKAECLKYLTFWVNSVIIHTLSDTGETAPIVFVGTRGDVISSPIQHASISTMLFEAFQMSPAWPFVLENKDTQGRNGKADLFFFPVNNRLGHSDNNLVRLLRVIEERIDASDYVHEEKPLCWLQLLDLLSARAKDESFLSFEEVVALGSQCDALLLTRESLPQVLHFLHQMGILLWHDEEGLRDVVILNPIEYFVEPATTVICKHSPSHRDHTYHSLEVHRECRKKLHDDWIEMIDKGIISNALLNLLLSQYSPNQTEMVRLLMIKYGLLVPLCTEGTELSFLAPALLPEDPHFITGFSDHGDNISHENLNGQHYWCDTSKGTQTFFFVFSASKKLEKETTLSVDDLKSRGFLPSGLFERMICKAVSWSQQTSVSGFKLRKEQVVLCYGSQRFRLTAHMALNVIQVEVEGMSPIAVQTRLKGQLEKIIMECMKALRFFVAVPCVFDAPPEGGSSTHLSPHSLYCEGAKNILLIRLEQVLQADQQKSALSLPGGNGRGRALLSMKELRSKYLCWLEHNKVLSQYDLFLSYRWGRHDTSFTQAMFDRLTTHTIDSNHRAIATFLDTYRLKEGKAFQYEFGKALLSALIVVPIISKSALERMLDHDPTREDNLLAEWILASMAYQWQEKHKQSSPGNHGVIGVRLRKVIPILFGKENRHGDTGNFFAENMVDCLPEIHPHATMDMVKEILRQSALLPIETIPWESHWQTVTVKRIVRDMLKFLCLTPWEYGNDPAKVITVCTERLLSNLRECIDDEALEKEEGGLMHNTSVPAQAKTLSSLFPPQSAAGSTLPVMDLVELIKKELRIEKGVIADVINEASAYLSADMKGHLETLSGVKDKLIFIAQQTGCIA